MKSEAALSDWAHLLGAQQVLDAPAAHLAYGADTNGISRRLLGALQILDGELLPEAMRIANRHGVPVYPISTGKNWGYGTSLPASDDCMILDLSKLAQILHFDAELGVVTLEPGVTQGMLAEFLDKGNHPFLVPVTGAGPTCSLVGNALERGYGITPYTDHFAAVTDLEAVLPDGSLYRTALREAGGEDLARLFKGGIGPASTGLFTQSGFGVVTRMSIALARRPECIKACLFSLKDDSLLETAVERIRGILSRLPGIVGGINLMNQHRVLAMSAPFPHDRLDADGMIPAAVIRELGGQYQIFPWTGFGTLYGSKRVVAAAQKEIRAALSGVASRLMFISPERAQTLATVAGYLPGAGGQRLASTVATLAKSLQLVAGRPNETALPLAYWRNPHPPAGTWRNPATDGCGLVWYAPLVPMRPAGIRDYVEMVKKVTRQHGIEPLITLTSISDRVFDSTVPIIFEKDRPAAQEAADNCYRDLLETGRRMGCFPYRVGIHSMEHLASLQQHARAFHGRLKNHLDPANILAPGRYN
ncbi:FAD-binding oxidoreductase [Undibacterium sp.]|jgi:4-cresol dehydrogenase (hydroxylating)|uniref:FAD-binding oxidoreductase n=1 Tax=Undibacterium sp. TaxID=1914977 RepID=UPI002B7B1F81|nr:FAD-binding oxidoreductase [Undibacterium sp.]HTD04486.1 FAD-binding oxidoreductase [Undibacterium sp.]